jgi:hypothetical protein
MKTTAVLLTALLFVSSFTVEAAVQDSALQRARQAFVSAQQLDATLNEKSGGKTRGEVLDVIEAYQRVYITTPHTSYADDALVRIAKLTRKSMRLGPRFEL